MTDDTFKLTRDGTRLRFFGSFEQHFVARAIAALHEAVDHKYYNDIVLDFSDVTAAFLSSMLPLCAEVLRRRELGTSFQLVLPKSRRLAHLFRNTNWASILDLSFDESEYHPTNQVPTTQFFTAAQQEKTVRLMIDGLLSSLNFRSRADLSAIEWALSEVTENVLRHAASPIGGLAALTTQQRRRVDYVVCDAGISIPKSFRSGHPGVSSDTKALELSIREGQTRDKTQGQGNGLFGSYEISRVSGSYFHIHSGSTELRMDMNRDLIVSRSKVPFSGTVIAAGILLSEPDVLARALRFNDKLYQPMDTIEYHYEDKELTSNDVAILVVNEVASLRSREAAKPLQLKLLNLARLSGNQKIIVDLSGADLISSSFADEIFGKIFLELGPLQFMCQFEIRGTNPVVRQLIDRALSLRSRHA